MFFSKLFDQSFSQENLPDLSVLAGLRPSYKPEQVEAANDEIMRLRMENAKLKAENERLKNPKRGRPRKKKWDFPDMEMPGFSPAKNKGGRPVKNSEAEMLKEIQGIEKWKQEVMKGQNVFISDQKALENFAEKCFLSEALYKRRSWIKDMYNKLKYYRQKLNIPQKQKTS